MIIDSIQNAARYYKLLPDLKEAFEFLSTTDHRSLKKGRNEVAGDRVFALLVEDNAKKKADCMLEIHKKYVDIQYIVSGIDEMGWKPTFACSQPAGPYDPARDLQFFKDTADLWVPVTAGMFAVFFPEDAHQPMVGAGMIRKVVMKVIVP